MYLEIGYYSARYVQRTVVMAYFLFDFSYSLFNDAFIISDYIAPNERMMVNWKGCERKRLWPDLRYYPGICLGVLRKTTKNLGEDSQSLGREGYGLVLCSVEHGDKPMSFINARNILTS
jgi:hypothetical protein